jgi:hypothetical protein
MSKFNSILVFLVCFSLKFTFANKILEDNFTAPGDTIDLQIKSRVVSQKISLDSDANFRFVVYNSNEFGTATNIKVGILAPYTPPFAIYESSNTTSGQFNVNSSVWTIPNIAAQDSAVLMISYNIKTPGAWYLEAEIIGVDQKDWNSTPNNFVQSEDDFSRACVTVPVLASNSPFVGRQIILGETGLGNVTWFRNNTLIQNQNGSALPVTSLGEFRFQSSGFICPQQGCCPFIFEEGVSNSCCEALEVSMVRNGFNGGEVLGSRMLMINDEPGIEDAAVTSILPNQLSGTGKIINPYAWTQNGNLNIKRTFIKFNLSELQNGIMLDSAFLDLYFSEELIKDFPQFTGHSGDNSLFISRVLSNWNENSITWNNQPNISPENRISIPAATNPLQDYTNIDVTNLLRVMLNNGNFGFSIAHQNETAFKITSLASKEDPNPAKRPRLRIYYH